MKVIIKKCISVRLYISWLYLRSFGERLSHSISRCYYCVSYIFLSFFYVRSRTVDGNLNWFILNWVIITDELIHLRLSLYFYERHDIHEALVSNALCVFYKKTKFLSTTHQQGANNNEC